ncbi:MAG: response regulator [Ktedonobacteraceae bacterium]|nr:response regulator [Ktedonobacteraceae bacterium]
MQKKVLVVDDDKAMLEAIRLNLETEGYSVQISINGECFQHLNGSLPDLILLDIVFPGEDGRDLCQQLKQREETRDIPIVLYSAHFSGDIMTYLSGASTFLAKPFEMHELIAITARYTASTQSPAPSLADKAALSDTVKEE